MRPRDAFRTERPWVLRLVRAQAIVHCLDTSALVRLFRERRVTRDDEILWLDDTWWEVGRIIEMERGEGHWAAQQDAGTGSPPAPGEEVQRSRTERGVGPPPAWAHLSVLAPGAEARPARPARRLSSRRRRRPSLLVPALAPTPQPGPLVEVPHAQAPAPEMPAPAQSAPEIPAPAQSAPEAPETGGGEHPAPGPATVSAAPPGDGDDIDLRIEVEEVAPDAAPDAAQAAAPGASWNVRYVHALRVVAGIGLFLSVALAARRPHQRPARTVPHAAAPSRPRPAPEAQGDRSLPPGPAAVVAPPAPADRAPPAPPGTPAASDLLLQERKARVLSAMPPDVPGQLTMAHGLLAARRPGEARWVYQQMLAARPKDPAVHAGLGGCDVDTEHYYRAIEHYRMALDLDAAHAPALMGMARAYRMLDRQQDAIEYYRLYLQHGPSPRGADWARRSIAELEAKAGPAGH